MKNSSLKLRFLFTPLMGVLIGAGALAVPAGPVHAAVFLDTRIRALDLVGSGINGPIALHLTPGTNSLGKTVLAPDGTPGDITPGNGQATVLSSFFDVFFDITSDPGSGPVTTSVIGHIAISAPCENPVLGPPLPPGCTYQGHPVYTVEDVLAVVTRHIANLGSVVGISPLPGFDFAEMFSTRLEIDTNPARGYILNGNMIVDAVAVPEPATLLLVVFGVAGVGLANRRRSHGAER